MSLRKVKFKDFIILQRGFDLPTKDREKGKYPVVASTSITDFHSEYKVDPPGVTTGRSGSLGEVLYLEEKFWPLNTTLWVKDFKGNLPLYVYYYLKTVKLEKYNSGAGVPTLNRNHLDSLEIEIHSKDGQKKIASILSAFDDLIENNTRRIEILEEMARRIYREWFVHFRYPGHENDGLVDSGTELGEIPEGWEVKNFGELVDYLRDSVKDEDVEEAIPVLGLGDMPKKSICLSDWEKTDNIGSTKLRFKRDDILFGKIRPYFHKVGFAQVEGVSSSDIFVWRAKDPKDFILALLAASSDKFVETATNSSSGTKMPRAKWDVLENYKVAYPTDNLLERLNSVVGNALKQIRTLSFQNKKLKETGDLLLPKLISGRIKLIKHRNDI